MTVGVLIAILKLSDIKETRQADLESRVHSTWISQRMMKSWARVMNVEFKDNNDFRKKFGSFPSENLKQVAFHSVANYFETIGYLLAEKRLIMD